jgi:hypothetical protein
MPLDTDDFKHPEFPTSVAFPRGEPIHISLDRARCRSVPLDLLVVPEVEFTPLDLVARARTDAA